MKASMGKKRDNTTENSLSQDIKLIIENDVKKTIDSQLRLYKASIISFCSGFILLILFGLNTKWQFIEPIATPAVWNSITHGSEEDYKRFVSKDEFYRALSEYHTELVRTFLVPNREPIVRASEILRAGKLPVEVNVLMGGAQIEGGITRHCNQIFKNDEFQIILVIPRSYERTEYSWFDCSFGWPEIFLNMNYAGRSLDNIKLVGVRRNGGTNNIIALITKRVAKELEMPSWKNYKTNTFAKISISKVDNWTQEQCLPVDPNKFPQNSHSIFDNNKRKTLNDTVSNIDNKYQVDKNSDIQHTTKLSLANISKHDINQNHINISSTNQDPNNDLLSNAISIFENRKYKDAYKLFEKSLSTESKERKKAQILFYMAECMYYQHEYDLAIIDYQKVITEYNSDPHAPRALLKQGISFDKLLDQDTAKIIYKKLISSYPDSNEASAAKKLLNNIQ